MSTCNSDLILRSQNLETSGDLAYDSGDSQEILTTIATGVKITSRGSYTPSSSGVRQAEVGKSFSRSGPAPRQLVRKPPIDDAWRPLSEAGAFRTRPRVDGGCPSTQKLSTSRYSVVKRI